MFATSPMRGLLSPGAAPGSVEYSERRASRISWPLTAILAVQTAVSLVLLRRDTAFADEALYLWAGRMEWAHWLHGHSLPGTGLLGSGRPFQDYFSGAPQVYPPLGALCNSIGGLVAARALGLLFMLGATCLLYATVSRLLNRNAALFASALWAISEPALKLGAFATYDPMAVFLICLGVWVSIESTFRKHHGELVALAGLCFAIGSVTAYSYVILVRRP